MFEVFYEQGFSTFSTLSVDLRNFLETIAAFASTNRIKDINEKFVDIPLFRIRDFVKKRFLKDFDLEGLFRA